MKAVFDGGTELEVSATLILMVILGFAAHGAAAGSARLGWQTLASALKFPCVPLFTLALTVPLLHATVLATGSDIPLATTIACALLPLAVASILMLAAAPLTCFFARTSCYHFTKLLVAAEVAIFGAYGANALRSVLMSGTGEGLDKPLLVFSLWLLIFFFVAAQMTWALRPIIGSPDLPFSWLRRKGDSNLNFYTAVLLALNSDKSMVEQWNDQVE
jgi:hypothetical protein